MKLAVSGKGGVGKTTLTASLAKLFSQRGKKVIAIDADPSVSLAGALGLVDAPDVVPIADMKELIEERTEAKSGGFGQMFKLNPHVSDLPEKLSLDADGIKLMVLGGIQKGGGGCACPENTFLRTLLNHLILIRDEVALLDMAAGVEHLGRATVQGVAALIVVVEPGLASVRTALQVTRLAGDIGIKKILAVGNKLRTDSQRQFLREQMADVPLLGFISYDEAIADADLHGRSAYDTCSHLVSEVGSIAEELAKHLNGDLG